MARVNLIQLRRGTTAQWAADPVLAQGEGGLDTDLGKIKYGDGTSAWSALTFIGDGAAAATLGGASLSTDGTFAANSDTKIPSEKAVKTYVDNIVTGLWDDRGNHDASGNAFPSSGGSGTGGAILKGDIWTVDVAGTLGGVAVTPGDTVRALQDTPTLAAHWALGEVNLGYTPENSANKDQASGYAGLTAGSLLKTAQFPAFTGHVTTTAGGVVTVIGAGVVTNAMLAGSIAFSKLVGTDITAVGTLVNLTVTNTISGSISGNAGSATVLQTARTINGESFDGSANITVAAAAGTLTGTTLASNVVSSSLTSVGTLATLTVTAAIVGSVTGNAGTATVLQNARTINGVSFDGSANITVDAAAGSLTGTTLAANVVSSSLTSVGTLVNLTVTNTISGSISGNAGTATVLATARTINGTSFNGSANILVDVDGGSP
jgi:hypothetical protein